MCGGVAPRQRLNRAMVPSHGSVRVSEFQMPQRQQRNLFARPSLCHLRERAAASASSAGLRRQWRPRARWCPQYGRQKTCSLTVPRGHASHPPFLRGIGPVSSVRVTQRRENEPCRRCRPQCHQVQNPRQHLMQQREWARAYAVVVVMSHRLATAPQSQRQRLPIAQPMRWSRAWRFLPDRRTKSASRAC